MDMVLGQPPELKAAGSIPAGRTINKTRAYDKLISPFVFHKILIPDIKHGHLRAAGSPPGSFLFGTGTPIPYI